MMGHVNKTDKLDANGLATLLRVGSLSPEDRSQLFSKKGRSWLESSRIVEGLTQAGVSTHITCVLEARDLIVTPPLKVIMPQ